MSCNLGIANRRDSPTRNSIAEGKEGCRERLSIQVSVVRLQAPFGSAETSSFLARSGRAPDDGDNRQNHGY
jgi:hypothetical protein